MICSLCLEEIKEEEFVVIEDRIRHKRCSDEFEQMIEELEKIYDETCPKEDI